MDDGRRRIRNGHEASQQRLGLRRRIEPERQRRDLTLLPPVGRLAELAYVSRGLPAGVQSADDFHLQDVAVSLEQFDVDAVLVHSLRM